MKNKKYLSILIITSFIFSGCSFNGNNTDNNESLYSTDVIPSSSAIYEELVPSNTKLPSASPSVAKNIISSPSPISTYIPSNTETPHPTSSIEVTYIPGASTPLPHVQSPAPTEKPIDVTYNPIETESPTSVTETTIPSIIDEYVSSPTPSPTPDDITIVEATPLPSEEEKEDIYDIFLFFGQSNMNSWPETNASMPPGFDDIHQYSIESGIDEDILSWTVSTSKVMVPMVDDSAYMYMYLSNSFKPISSDCIDINGEGFYDSGYIGDVYENSYGGLRYNPDTGNLEQYHIGDPYISCQISANQTMIPEFCRKYYELTGHKVISVLCAVGGAPIECFLPSDDADNYYNVKGNTQHYMYEGLVENFNSAVALAESNGFNIGGKYWICFQGEGNLGGSTLYSYYDLFMKVKNNMARDIGTTKGAIVYTSNEIGTGGGGFYNLLYMHDVQTQLAANNSDIFIGSSFDYDHFVPSEDIYWSDKFVTSIFIDDDGNKLPYDVAYSMAKKLTSYEYDFFDSGSNNRIHLLSCTLSQIGRECAIGFADELGF